MSFPETTAQHVARRLELITNWLALFALLGIGVLWGPSAEDRAAAPAAPAAALRARAQAPRATHSCPHPAAGPVAPADHASAAAISAGSRQT